MPYEAGTFSHVVSQDALFLVPDKPRSHAEIHRVLRPGGIFAFSDFLQPTTEIGERARKHVYDRVRWNGGYSFVGYQAALEDAGFEIMLARNLQSHIRQTYRVLGAMARERADEHRRPGRPGLDPRVRRVLRRDPGRDRQRRVRLGHLRRPQTRLVVR